MGSLRNRLAGKGDRRPLLKGTVPFFGRLAVAGMFFLVAIAGWTQPTGKSDPEAKATESDKDKAPSSPFEGLKNLPPGAIIVVCEDLKSAKQLNPNLILLTPKQYQELRDQSARAKNSGPTEEIVPAECRLTGNVDGEVVRLQAEFKIVTEKDHENVQLGCKLAQ